MYNLGDKFFTSIVEWLNSYPEVKHIWRGKSLVISSPNDENRVVSISFKNRTIEVFSKGIEKKFKQRCFVKINQQMLDIHIYLMRELHQGKKIQVPKMAKSKSLIKA